MFLSSMGRQLKGFASPHLSQSLSSSDILEVNVLHGS